MEGVEKAKKLIAKAKDENSTFLDLGNLGLTQLPDELFELKRLEFLNLGSRYIKNGRQVKSSNALELNIIKWVPWKIRRLSNLSSLSLHATYVGDISGLKELCNLKYLDLGFAYFIKDYSPLVYMRNIEVLNLHTNYLKGLPFLKRFKSLRYLDISFNNFKNIDFVKNLTELEYFGIQWYDGAIDFSHFQHLPKLLRLNVASNSIVNHGSLNRMKKLSSLNMYDTQTSSLDFLRGLSRLKTLNLWRNNVSDIEVVGELSALEVINIRENKVKNINCLNQLKNLKELDVSFNLIENKAIEKEFAHLEKFNCQENVYNKTV